MAKMYPPRFPYPKDGGRRAEKDFYEACQKQLDDTWTVLYDVAWHGKRNNRVERGDADFILMSESFGLLAIEVKGGTKIEIEKGRWYSTPNWSNEKKEIKDPFRQVGESKSVLFDYIKQNVPQVNLKGPFGHLLVFPGHVQNGPIGPNGPRDLICDRNDIKNLAKTLNGAREYLNSGSRLSSNEIIAIKEKLMPSFTLIGPKFFNLKDAVDELGRLTEVQLRTFSMLRGLSKLTVVGGPGTGKTVLAFNKAHELAEQGLSVLYICSSQALAAYLTSLKSSATENVQNNLTIHYTTEFHAVLYKNFLLNSKKMTLSELPQINDRNFPFHDEYMRLNLDEQLELLKNQIDGDGVYDALVIDEAQVIGPQLYQFAITLLGNSEYIYIFGDRNQNWIWKSALFGLGSGSSLLDVYGSEDAVELSINCRSTKEIVEFSELLSQSSLNSLSASAFPVQIMAVDSEDWVVSTSNIIIEWVKDFGIEINDITLLVEPVRLYEGIWGDKAGYSQFEANEEGITFHDGFAIDWWSGPGWPMGRRRLDLLTQGKSYLPLGFDEENEIGDSIRRSFDPYVAISQSLSEGVWYASWDKHREAIANVEMPIVTARTISNFQGMESKAVIVLNPIPSQERYLAELYAMTTRASVLLAVIVSPASALLLNSLGIISGFA